MNLELLNQGLTAMGIGMGVVLSFLIILIASMAVMSNVVGYLNKIFPEAVVREPDRQRFWLFSRARVFLFVQPLFD